MKQYEITVPAQIGMRGFSNEILALRKAMLLHGHGGYVEASSGQHIYRSPSGEAYTGATVIFHVVASPPKWSKILRVLSVEFGGKGMCMVTSLPAVVLL